jgi:hypothetical protein
MLFWIDFSIFKENMERKKHNILSLILNRRFKNLRLISSHFIEICISPQFDVGCHIPMAFVFQLD